jgi:hypothetical protein
LHELRVRLKRISTSSLNNLGSFLMDCGMVTDDVSDIELCSKSLKWTLSMH